MLAFCGRIKVYCVVKDLDDRFLVWKIHRDFDQRGVFLRFGLRSADMSVEEMVREAKRSHMMMGYDIPVSQSPCISGIIPYALRCYESYEEYSVIFCMNVQLHFPVLKQDSFPEGNKLRFTPGFELRDHSRTNLRPYHQKIFDLYQLHWSSKQN